MLHSNAEHRSTEPNAASKRRPNRADSVAVARHQFLSDRRIDLGDVAAELGVNRTTVYRWFDGREGLVTETLWSLSSQTLDQAVADAKATGLDWVYEVVRDSTTAIARNVAYRGFLRREPELAARVLFTNPDALRVRTISAYQRLLESRREALSSEAEPAAVARAIVRCGEPFLYGDQLGAADPDPEATMEVLRMILGWARRES